MHFYTFLQVFWADNNDLGTIKYVHKNDSDHINILRRKTPGVTEMFMYNPTSQSKFTIYLSLLLYTSVSFCRSPLDSLEVSLRKSLAYN